MRRKIAIVFLVVLLTGVLLFLFRTPLLRSCATFLIREDSLQQADAIFVLSGGGYDRGNLTAKLYDEGWAPKIVCTGGNELPELCVFDIDTLESDMTRVNLLQHGVPDSVIVMIRQGTSTKQEANIIFDYCKRNKLKRVIIVSSKLHTYRVQDVFRKKLNENGTALVVRGAPSSRFSELEWWKTENGLIAINNEWIKTFYYWIKY
jgi:uncharacterized SAM-binding protein YcdF (DUF218 family)